jgi:ankyrin repeat protein
MVHVTVEIARHAGHADIVRELIDGAAGDNDGNLPDQTAQEWATYRLQLKGAAVEATQRAELCDPSRPRTSH